jgi:hypothetical protein
MRSVVVENHEFTVLDLQVEILNGDHLSEDLSQVLDEYSRHFSRSSGNWDGCLELNRMPKGKSRRNDRN